MKSLVSQPELFPTPDGGIQMEYDKDTGDYLEFQLRNDSPISVFILYSDDTEKSYEIPFDVQKVNEVVSSFYG